MQFSCTLCTFHAGFMSLVSYNLWTIPPSSRILLHLERLHWLRIKHRSLFKTALLVDKFLQSYYHKYFEPFLNPRNSVYRTRSSQSDGFILEISHFTSIYEFKRMHIGLIFAYVTPRIWNELPDNVRLGK